MQNHNVELMKNIKEDIDKLIEKTTQYQGAVQTLKIQEKEMVSKFQQEYNLKINDIPVYLQNTRAELETLKENIIAQFTNLYNNDYIHSYIKINPPFTVEQIYDEIQNNLLSLRSQTEGQLKGLEKQQDDISKILKEEYNIDVKKADQSISKLDNELMKLQEQIQSLYADIMQDDELKMLLNR